MAFIASVHQQISRDRTGDKPPSTVYNKASGKHQKPAQKMNTTEWWRDSLFGAAPASLRNRKKTIDKASKG